MALLNIRMSLLVGNRSHPAIIYLLRVNNKDTRTRSMTSFWCLWYLWTYFTPFSSVSMVDLELVNVCWAGTLQNTSSEKCRKTEESIVIVSQKSFSTEHLPTTTSVYYSDWTCFLVMESVFFVIYLPFSSSNFMWNASLYIYLMSQNCIDDGTRLTQFTSNNVF